MTREHSLQSCGYWLPILCHLMVLQRWFVCPGIGLILRKTDIKISKNNGVFSISMTRGQSVVDINVEVARFNLFLVPGGGLNMAMILSDIWLSIVTIGQKVMQRCPIFLTVNDGVKRCLYITAISPYPHPNLLFFPQWGKDIHFKPHGVISSS